MLPMNFPDGLLAWAGPACFHAVSLLSYFLVYINLPYILFLAVISAVY